MLKAGSFSDAMNRPIEQKRSDLTIPPAGIKGSGQNPTAGLALVMSNKTLCRLRKWEAFAGEPGPVLQME
jgi:hypothetical protein